MVHRSRVLGADDVHPVRRPPRTRLTRSLLDAAVWSGSDNRAGRCWQRECSSDWSGLTS